MDLTLSPEQELLAATARSFAERNAAREFGRDLWREMVDLGWTDLGVLDAAVVCEALGQGGLASPLAWSTAAAHVVALGERIATLAVVDAPGSTTTKVLVPWAADADVIVAASGDELRVVEVGRGGLPCRRHADLGADPLFEVDLAGTGGDVVPFDGRVLDIAAVLELATTVGACERVIEMTVAYAKDRQQFGRPIGSFQAVAHRCVDMRTDLDACRYLMLWAAWTLDRGEPADLPLGAAKAYADGALRRLLGHAHQVHGAIGFSTEHDLHRFTRRAKAFELSHGGTEPALERVAVAMGLR
jgi:3-oxocholest-4-en-26-oyl-CoA dehydrogenase beta subunit